MQASDDTTPVEASAEAAVEQSEATATPEATESESPQESPEQRAERKSKGVQKRIDELTAARHRAEREADFIREQYEAAQRQLKQFTEKPQQQAKPTAQAEGRPTIDQYDNVDDYVAAVTDWKLAQVEKEREAKTREAQARQEQETLARKVTEQTEKARQKYADFDEVVVHNPDLPITQTMAQSLVEMDAGADVAYHLGKNPQEAARIAALPASRQLIELGKLEASLSFNAKTVTKAPPPVGSQVTGGATSGGLSDKMSVKEWIAARNAQLRQS